MKRVILNLLLLLPALAAYADGIKIQYGPYLQNVGENEVTVVWVASASSVGWVELAPDDNSNFYSCERPKFFDSKIGVKNVSTIHAVRITGLAPGTTYRYRIFSQEVLSHQGVQVRYGGVASTAVYNVLPLTFTTSSVQKKQTSFVVLNDVHGRQGLMTKLLEYADYKSKDLVIFNGDMVSEFSDEATVFSGFMNEGIDLFAKEKPFYYARGNHETRGVHATHFQDYFNPRKPNLYYTFRQGPVCFVLLDTGEDKPDSDIEYSGIVDYDNYRSEQAQWLKEVVETDDFKSAEFRVVIAHMPPSARGTSAWHGNNDLTAKFIPILNKAGVDLMCCGHEHKQSYYEAGQGMDFPLLVNSNNACVSVDVKDHKMSVKVLDVNGKVTLDKTFPAK